MLSSLLLVVSRLSFSCGSLLCFYAASCMVFGYILGKKSSLGLLYFLFVLSPFVTLVVSHFGIILF